MTLHCGTQRQFLSVSSTSQRSSWPQPLVAGGSRSARVLTRAVDIETYSLEPMIENVTYEDGMFKVSGVLHSNASTDLVYGILTDYTSLPRVFHNVDHCWTRTGEDGRLFITQMVLWNFLIFRGSFETELEVFEYPEELKLSFNLLQSAFMNQFVGTWNIESESSTGTTVIRHSLSVAPSVKPPQKIGDITKKIFEAQVKGILRDLAAELSRADP